MSRSGRLRYLTALVGVSALVAGIAILPPHGAGAQAPLPPDLPGRHIVVFKPSVTDPEQAALELARRHGLALGPIFRVALKGFAATVSPTRLEALAQDPRVAYVEKDQIYRAFAATPLTSGVDRVDADASATAKIDGTNDGVDVDIAII